MYVFSGSSSSSSSSSNSNVLCVCLIAPQLRLLPTQYATTTTATLATGFMTPAAILDRSSRDYMTALEKNYLIF